MPTDGILVIDKPAGPTSHDVVDRIRAVFGQRKVGHTGTLDPLATGVLPLLLGRATKLSQHLTGTGKAYRTTIRLGVETSTLDAAGEILREAEVAVTSDDVRAALDAFRGEIQQIPPMHSAKHHKGRRLHELARKGIEVEREPVSVRVDSLDVVEIALPDVTLDLTCSAGTYVRVLAQDLGRALGCGGFMQSLRRTAAGPFTLDEATPLSTLEDDPAAAAACVLDLDGPELLLKLQQYFSAGRGDA